MQLREWNIFNSFCQIQTLILNQDSLPGMEGQLVNFGPGSDPGPSGHPIDPVAVVHPDLGELAPFSAVVVPSVGSVEELNPIERKG